MCNHTAQENSQLQQYAYPSNYHISSGVGRSQHHLVAFDNALIEAGISNYNLIRVSSILPMGCVQKEQVTLKQGSILPTAYATISTTEPGLRVATAVAVGVPADRESVGVIMEYSGHCTAQEAEEIVCDMVREAMANHQIIISEIVVSAIDAIGEEGKDLSLVSAISMW